jgi:hypothetical protein
MKKRKSHRKQKKRLPRVEKNHEADGDSELIAMYRQAMEAFLYEGDEPDIPGLLDCLTPHYLDEEEKHWTLICLAGMLSGEGHPEWAFNLINHSLRISHNCPEARWVLGCVMGSRGQVSEAIQVWTELVCTPVRKLAYGGCKICNNDNLPFARRIVADSKFGLSVAYWMAGYPALARHFKCSYMKDLDRGVKSNCCPDDLEIVI